MASVVAEIEVNKKTGKITDDSRIRAALPTIETLRDRAWRASKSALIYTSGVWVLGNTTRPADEETPLIAAGADGERSG